MRIAYPKDGIAGAMGYSYRARIVERPEAKYPFCRKVSKFYIYIDKFFMSWEEDRILRKSFNDMDSAIIYANKYLDDLEKPMSGTIV